MATEGQEEQQEEREGQEGQAPPQQEHEAQEAPRYDYDPELVRSQYEEVKRREREAAAKERELEKRARELERTRFNEPPLESMDPSVAYLARMIQEDREERRREKEERDREREEQAQMERVGHEAFTAFVAQARSQGLSREQASREWNAFTDLLTEHYPHHSMISSVGADRAVRNVLPLFKSNGARVNGQPQTTTTRLSPRTPIVTSQGTGPIEDRADVGPQRQGESNEQYAQRVMRNFENLGLKGMSLKDGERISSE